MTKPYHAERGMPIDANFLQHVANGCAQCKRYEEDKPGTLSLLCLEGSVLWKRMNAEPAPKTGDWKPQTTVSKKAVKAAMKYK